jgi:hypothetical protein
MSDIDTRVSGYYSDECHYINRGYGCYHDNNTVYGTAANYYSSSYGSSDYGYGDGDCFGDGKGNGGSDGEGMNLHSLSRRRP